MLYNKNRNEGFAMDNIEYGGFWRRFLASIIDGLISMAVGFSFVYFLLYWILPSPDEQVLEAAKEVTDSLFSLAYGIIVPVIWSGFTIGKKALGVKIQKVTGEEVTFWTMIKRVIIATIIYVISLGILLVVSFFMVIIRDDKRTIHDFVAGTHVVRAD
jgi:uncharacterized RDD family membrane protein YckC